ncbi:MAG: restriction endonuclease subunit S [Nitrospira sp.]|nr:restriction endonuclease subunit S [Nitrospira sp.]
MSHSQLSTFNSQLIPAGYKQTEVGIIPDEWEVCAVRQKGEVVTGKALAVNAPGLQRPYLRTKNVFDGRIDIGDVLTMPMTEEQFTQFQIRSGDVLLNEGQSIDLVGRCALYQNEYPEPCAIQNALLRFRARPGVSEKFASYLFRHCQHTGVFARIALQTTSVAHLGGSRFEKLRLAWPTELEQHAIAEALSDADALIESLEQLLAKKRQIKQGAMQELLSGKKRLPGFSGEWEVKRLGDETDRITKGTTPTSLGRNFTDQGINFVKVESLSEEGSVISEMLAAIDDNTHRLLKRSQLREKDILFSIAGALGRTAIVKTDLLSANTNQALAIIRIKAQSCLRHDFLLKYLAGPQILAHITAINVQAAQANLSLEDIRSFEVPAPSPDEQIAIATVLSDMDAEIAALEAKLAKARLLKQGMMQELLTGRIRLIN